ncbi:hypothetical protein J6590_082182 [Homalodisca vitripennis]|nr:hypothetical protein J6590_082182 [Homalodisca vitripennis]
MDVQERHITNRKCRDSGLQGLETLIKEEQFVLCDANFLYSNLLLYDNGDLPKLGDKIKMPLLAKTLKIVSESPRMADELYEGTLTKSLVDDIRGAGGIITAKDFADYRAKWQPPVQARLSGNLTLYSVPPPGSGLLLTFMLQLLDGFVTEAPSEVEVTQRITEAFKHAYGRRTDIADPDYYNISQFIFDIFTQQGSLLAGLSKPTTGTAKTDVSLKSGKPYGCPGAAHHQPQMLRFWGARMTVGDGGVRSNLRSLASLNKGVPPLPTLTEEAGSELASPSSGRHD